MRIQVISDIHSEFHQDGGASFVGRFQEPEADVLVVAGDIGTLDGTFHVLEELARLFPHVVCVMGNHDYYHSSIQQVERLSRHFSKKVPNLHVLENDTVTINGQRFVGGTLWFPDSPKVALRKNGLNDYHLIGGGFEEWVKGRNKESVEFLQNSVTSKDVVVTHHIPTSAGVHSRWRNAPLNLFFTCDLSALIQDRQPRLWAYGHTHDSLRFQIGDTLLVCNPFGYLVREENPRFSWDEVVDIGG